MITIGIDTAQETADLKTLSESKMQGWSKSYRWNGQIPDTRVIYECVANDDDVLISCVTLRV